LLDGVKPEEERAGGYHLVVQYVVSDGLRKWSKQGMQRHIVGGYGEGHVRRHKTRTLYCEREGEPKGRETQERVTTPGN
jgi:hypothetical protein